MNAESNFNMVLVVDDSRENLSLLARILSRKGYEVLSASSGEQAIELAGQHEPSLILLDVNMPEMDGFETCRRIKKDPRLTSIPIIFISGRTDTMDKLDALTVGAVDYITKPFDSREVLARVRTQLALRDANLMLEHKNQELKQSYDALNNLEHVRDNLVGMIVHDMRSPLQVVSNALKLLSSSLGDHLDDESREDLRAAKQGVAEVIAMADSVLEIRRLQDAETPLDIKSYDLIVLVGEVVRELSLIAGQHALVFEPPSGQLPIECDEDYVKRMLGNLISNAFKAMPTPGRATVAIEVTDDGYEISVSDTGVGISQDVLESIFDAYVGDTAVPGYNSKGSIGLGLSLCKLTAEAHQGSITVHSEVGVGSTFSVRLPRGQHAAQ